jgi:hypothetical protein
MEIPGDPTNGIRWELLAYGYISRRDNIRYVERKYSDVHSISAQEYRMKWKSGIRRRSLGNHVDCVVGYDTGSSSGSTT